jgi:hypothetical protein
MVNWRIANPQKSIEQSLSRQFSAVTLGRKLHEKTILRARKSYAWPGFAAVIMTGGN